MSPVCHARSRRRAARRRLLPLAVALCLPVAAAAVEYQKCIGPDGNIGYSDEPCPPGARAERIEIEETGDGGLPSLTAPEAFLPPVDEPAEVAPAVPSAPRPPDLAKQCGEARADSRWFLMQQGEPLDQDTRNLIEQEEAERQRFIERYCR